MPRLNCFQRLAKEISERSNKTIGRREAEGLIDDAYQMGFEDGFNARDDEGKKPKRKKL